MQLMFYSTLEYHTLLYQEVVQSIMALLDEVMLLHIFAHPFSELVMLGMLGMHIVVAIRDP
jgi:hypothetical protein